MKRREFLKTAGIGIAAMGHTASAAGTSGRPPGKQPNIVFIMADDLGYGDVGCYGQEDIDTPNIDRLAAEGMRFTHAYAGAPVCAPSRSVLMTGLHTGHTRVRGNHGQRDHIPSSEYGQRDRVPLRPEDVTVAEVLRDAGYATGITGKWGLGEPGSTGIPTRQGFDQWLGFLNQDRADNYYTNTIWRNDEKSPIPANRNGQRRQYVHDLFTEMALDCIKQNRDRPFFLYVPYTIPHKLYQVPDLGRYASTSWSEEEKTYAAMISRMDRDVGKILNLLSELNIEENTIVIFTSDNGASGNAKDWRFNSWRHLRGSKGTVYEGGLRVPAIARWSGSIPAGQVNDCPWYFADFLPTAVELAGAQLPGETDGISLVPVLLQGKRDIGERFLYWEHHSGGFQQAIRWRNWKAVRAGQSEKLALYDLSQDESETMDISAHNPAIIREFKDYLVNARTESRSWPVHLK